MEHVGDEINKQDIKNYVKMKFHTELTLIKEKLSLFEKKYKCDFSQFEKAVIDAEEENFEQWDDYMEWKAFYNKYNQLIQIDKKTRQTNYKQDTLKDRAKK